mgnify:CR=1 FL=1
MPKQGETTTKFKVDISELKKNISDAQRQIRLANAEFKAAAAGMDNWQTSSNGLTAKLGQLRTVLSSQKSILESLKTQYAQVAAEQGENSRGAQELAIKIANQQAAVNKTEKSLNEYERELKDVQKAEDLAARNGKSVEENLRELGDTSEKTAEDVKKSSEGFTVLKGALANLAAQGIQMAVSAMKDLAKETWEGVKAAAAYADEVNTLSAQTGISTEKLQEFKYMEDLIDVSTETMTGSMAKLVRNMASAQDGTGNAAEAFKALGVSVTDANGELRNNQDVFGEVIDALGKMENETERDAIAMAIFGKSAGDLNPLIEDGGETYRKVSEIMAKYGLEPVSQEALDRANEFNDKIDTIKAAADLKDLKVAVENGSAGQDAATEAGVKNIVAVQDQAAALLEVKSGTSDACVIDITMAKAMTGEGTDYADLAAGISLTSEEYGIGFRKGSDLTAAVNEIMTELMASGALQALADKYNLTLAG